MSDSITKNFDQLGVPLINQNWSWGASNDAVVVLRAWQDQIKRLPDRTMLSLLWQDWWGKNSSGGVSLGGNERFRHLEEIKAGKPCLVILMHDKWGGRKILNGVLSRQKAELFSVRVTCVRMKMEWCG
jgi:hypothetical protein